MNTKVASFCAIGDFPYKALNNKKLLMSVSDGMLKPIHAVIIPTNECNLNCSFCCCSNRQKCECLSIETIQRILVELSNLGTKAITLSGGGEPLLYESILETISSIRNKHMKTGLVTNGILIDKLQSLPCESIEWCRISFGDGRPISEVDRILASAASLKSKGIIGLVGVSYIITSQLDKNLVDEIIRCAIKYHISYVKFTLDERTCVENQYPEYIRNLNYENKIITPVTFSPLNEVSCLLHLVKPIFAADGYVYPCCENQYNNEDGFWCYDKKRRVMSYIDYFRNIKEQIPYVCKKCPKCFHSMLVSYLNSTKNGYFHEDFI